MLFEIATLEEFKAHVGKEVGLSSWIDISQDRVDMFAEATDDHQWIHVDVERAKKELPTGGTVAHGFLTLALLPKILWQTVSFGEDARMLINYGLNRVRFPSPLPVGNRVRGRVNLQSVEEIPGGVQLIWEITVEREGGDKPVCVAEFILRRY